MATDPPDDGTACGAPDSPAEPALDEGRDTRRAPARSSCLRYLRSYLSAVFAGSVYTAIGIGCLSIPAMMLSEGALGRFAAPLAWASGFFVGGIISGTIMEPEIRHRRWRFFHLAGSAPGTLVWGATVIGLLAGVHLPNDILLSIIVLSIFSMAGTVVGSTVTHRQELAHRKPSV